MNKSLRVLVIIVLLLTVIVSCTDKDGKDNNKMNNDGTLANETGILTNTEMYDKTSEVIEIKSFDDYMVKGKLTIPAGEKEVLKLVIYVNGSGANTYDNRRTGFNYFDFFADEFSNRGIAFLSYSTRGCEIGDEPPMYVDINEEEYQTYLPSTSVEDVYYMINTIKENDRLKNSKVYLLGWSEGTIIAPLVAEKYPDSVDAIFLAGYANQNMKDILIWQNSGSSSMVWYSGHFETDKQGRITKIAYEADPKGAAKTILKNANFEDIDKNKDGYLTQDDFALIIKESAEYSLNDILSAIDRRDDDWLKKNYGGGLITLTSGWFLEHFKLLSNMDVLPKLDLPIYIFHGTVDPNVDVKEVYKIDEKFKEMGKTNLKINVFEAHNHDLNFMDIFGESGMSEGLRAIFDTISSM